jgi:hypothetical protein
MREFTEEEIGKWIEFTDKNVLPKEEFLGRCHQCGEHLENLELPEGPEKKIVCLKDRKYFVEGFEELEEWGELQ